MPTAIENRWRCEILKPTDLEVIWSCDSPNIINIKKEWDEQFPCNKDFVNIVRLNRSACNKLKNGLIKVYKINSFGDRPSIVS
jgi:hypothetical protein